MKSIINEILSEYEEPPVVIVQSDHGNQSILYNEEDAETPSKAALVEKVEILNAYLLPEKGMEQLYSSITPVNSFRVVLNCFFGEEYELLEDRHITCRNLLMGKSSSM